MLICFELYPRWVPLSTLSILHASINTRIKMLLFLRLIKIGRFFLFRVSGIRRISATFRLFEEESLTNFCDIVATATANESVKKAIRL